MVRKLVSATVSAALCLFAVAPIPASAQDYRFTGFDAPRGATATVNLRVPMGREHAQRASYGLTLSYGTGDTAQFSEDFSATGFFRVGADTVLEFDYNHGGLIPEYYASLTFGF